MPKVIILSAADKEAVQGPSALAENHMLAPLPLSDGTFFVGEEVLNDPMHAAHHERLAGCPLVDYDDVKSMIPQTPEAKPS